MKSSLTEAERPDHIGVTQRNNYLQGADSPDSRWRTGQAIEPLEKIMII